MNRPKVDVTATQIVLSIVFTFIGGLAVGAIAGMGRNDLPWLLIVCLILGPLPMLVGVVLRKYLFPTH